MITSIKKSLGLYWIWSRPDHLIISEKCIFFTFQNRHIPRHRTDEEVTEMPDNILKQLSYDLLWGMLAVKFVPNVVVECMY